MDQTMLAKNISIVIVTWTTWRRGAGACVASGRTPLLEGVPVAGRAQHDAGPSTHRGYQKRSSIVSRTLEWGAAFLVSTNEDSERDLLGDA